MGCCGINGDAKEEAEEEKRAKKTNKDIERQIQKDKQVCTIHNYVSFDIFDVFDIFWYCITLHILIILRRFQVYLTLFDII